ncbi:signal peptidase I [Haloarchaeobius sp. DFWS5]|uniref:signal peptidase I n=1 Tax=Haloarchaeobius sp. DFWS5 TaxID=3446114 RepID=UPI003EB7A4BF
MTKKQTSTRRLPGGTPLLTVVNVVAIVLLLAAVVPFVIYSVPQVVGADQSYVVLTGSMEPAISPGDVVVVTAVDADAVGVGDVIIYNRERQSVPTTHRVIEVVETETGERAFRTKGDANEDPDSGMVTEAALIGKITLTLPYIGYVIEFTNSPTGFIALVLLPFALLVLNELWSLFRAWRGSDDDGDSAAAATVATAATSAGSTSDSATASESETEHAGEGEESTVATAAIAATASTDDDTITFTRDGLLLGSGVAGLLTLYSGVVLWIAYSRSLPFQQFVTLTMMGFVASVALLLVLLRAWSSTATTEDDAEPEEPRPSVTDGGHDRTESVENRRREAGSDD